MRFLRQFLLFPSAVLLVCIGFQNCGQTIPGFGKIGTVQDGPGNGSGYEGNHASSEPGFVLRGSCGGVDGAVVSVIITDGDAYYLTFDQCQPVAPPEVLPSSAITVNPATPAVIIYNGQNYTREK